MRVFECVVVMGAVNISGSQAGQLANLPTYATVLVSYPLPLPKRQAQ